MPEVSVRYVIDDVPAAVAFYTTLLGFKLDLDAFPTLRRIEAACLQLPAFDAARPENQPDAA